MRRTSRRLRGIATMLRGVFALFCLWNLATCSKSSAVVISITGMSDDVQSLRVRAFTTTQAGRPQILDRNTTKLVIDVPDNAEGPMTVVVTGRDKDTCNLSRAEQAVDLSASRLSYPVLDLALAPLAGNRTCTLGIYLDGPGGSVKVDENGKVCSAQSPRDCELDFVFGNQATLDGRGDTGKYISFHGDCHRVQRCSITTTAAHDVSAAAAAYIDAGNHLYWYNPLPFGLTMKAIWGSEQNNIWIGAEHGNILHWDGARWSGSTLPSSDATVRAIFGTGPGDIWAGTEDGRIYHSNGDTWIQSRGPTTLFSNGFFGVDSGEIWSIGIYQNIDVFRNGQWMNAESSRGVPPNFLGIWGSSKTNIIAIGEVGLMRTYDGTKWSPVDGRLKVQTSTGGPQTTIMDTLNSIAGSGSDDIWIAGENLTAFHYNGAFWSEVERVNSSGQGWKSVYSLGRGVALFVGPANVSMICETNSTGAQCKKSTWNTDPTRAFNQNAVWGSSRNNIWSVGDWGSILHFNGMQWEPYSNATIHILRAIWGTGPNDIYVAGDSGRILRWDGVALREFATGVTPWTMSAISGTGPTDIWFVGAGGQILHFDGTAWRVMSTGNSNDALNSIWSSATNRAWAVGNGKNGSTIVGRVCGWDGTKWTCQDDANYKFNGVWAALPDQVWATNDPLPPSGVSGIIRRWKSSPSDGTATVPLGTAAKMTGLFGIGNTVWSAGSGGTICRFDASVTNPMCNMLSIPVLPSSGTAIDVNAIFAISSSDLWAVGKQSVPVHIVNNVPKLVPVATGPGTEFLSVWANSPTDAWIVGSGNTVLRYQP